MKTDNRIDCSYFLEHLDELLTNDLPAETRRRMEHHAATCERCAAEWQAARRALEAVTPQIDIPAPADLNRRILDAVRQKATASQTAASQTAGSEPAGRIESQNTPSDNRTSHTRRRRWIGILSGALSAAAVIAVALTIGLNTPVRAARNSFSQAISSMEEVQSIRIELRIRTSEAENFDYTNPQDEFVPHTIEAIYKPQLLWRVEKPGRKALYDGHRTYLWFDSLHDGLILPYAPGTIGMLNLLIDPSQLLNLELQLTRANNGSRYELHRDAETLRLTVTSPAQGDFSQSDRQRNTSIIESNTRREYRFDALNGRLLGARVVFLNGDQERTLLEIDRITYDAPLDAAALTALPEGINWTDQTRNAPSSRLTGIDAKEAARLILDAFATWDSSILDEALDSYGAHAREILKSRYTGATVVKLSDPVRSGRYPGWFVPCELRMADQTTERIQLALRNDNPAGSWVIDGGL